DADGLDGEHFERPEAGEADVAEAGGDVDKEAEAADAGATFDLWDEVVRFGALGGAAEVELVGAEDKSFRRYDDAADAVRLGHVEDDFLVDHQFVVEGEVVAVGVERLGVEGVDLHVAAETGEDFLA